jgi:hypothetical protein
MAGPFVYIFESISPVSAVHSKLQLYSAGLGTPQTDARVTREEGAVALKITAEATSMQIGLLEVCVAAAFLLQSGRRID